MTAAARTALPRRISYFSLSRAPRYSVLFALPLLVAYETLAALLAQPGQGELRNGADVMLRSAFTRGRRRDTVRRSSWPRHPARRRARRRAIFGRAGPGSRRSSSAACSSNRSRSAGVFGIVIGVATSKLLGSLRTLMIAQGGIATMAWPTRLMLSLGAGLYEELFFRVLLVGGLAAGRAHGVRFRRARGQHIRRRDRRDHFLGVPLHRPVRRSVRAAVVHVPHAERPGVQRPLCASRFRRHRVDARAIRLVPASALV